MRTIERGGRRSRVQRCAAPIAVTVALLALVACSSSSDAAKSTTTTATASAPAKTRPAGPAAELSTELPNAEAAFLGEGTKPDLAKVGYVQREYIVSGTATSYKTDALTADGRWTYTPDTTAPYRTRILVRAPAKASKFSGNVMLEWLNVSGGADANPEWVSTAEEIERSGDVWVGVSAQRIGVEGGPVLVKVEGVPGAENQGKGMKAIDPARYGTLEHPGDGYAFDIFSQVARAVRAGGAMNGPKPKQVLAGGESQSAFALVTYYNGVQPLTQAFDGFFIHSRGAVGIPLVGPGKSADIAGAISGTATIFRTDQGAPVLDIQTETDVASILNSYAARQPDTARFRLWEVAGTAHADKHLLGAGVQYIDCGVPVNDGPMHIVAKAAWHDLKAWIETGKTPVVAPRITVTPGATLAVERNGDAIALGGIRTPPVDVPVAAVSGQAGPNPSTICLLLGSTKPLTAARIAALYPSRAAYLKAYNANADKTIKAGFVLPADRAALLAFANPSTVQG